MGENEFAAIHLDLISRINGTVKQINKSQAKERYINVSSKIERGEEKKSQRRWRGILRVGVRVEMKDAYEK